MRIGALTALLAMALAGCAGAPGSTAPDGDFVDTFGTPFLVVLKIPACIATAAIAAPVAGVSAIIDNDGGRETRSQARETLSRTCGPPYALAD